NFRVLEQRDLENARSPFRVVQDDGGEVGWVNRFLDRQRVRCVADSSLRGYAHDLLHFLRWWAGVSHSPEISEEAGTEATLLDYIRFQTNQPPYVQLTSQDVYRQYARAVAQQIRRIPPPS